MLSKVSSTFGLSSASIAASDIEFSMIVLVEIGFRRSAGFFAARRRRLRASAGGLNGVAAGGADGGATSLRGRH